MSLKRKTLCAAVLSVLFMAISFTAWGHPGRTDSSGGHYDRSTGEYHYHHGYPAHQHPGGVCPYDFDDKTESTSSLETKSASNKIKYVMPFPPSYLIVFVAGAVISAIICSKIVSSSNKSAYDSLTKENADLKSANKRLESDYKNMLASRDKLNLQCKDFIDQNAELKKDLENYKKDFKDYEKALAENKTLSEENVDLNNRLHHYVEQVDSLLHIDDTSGIMTYDEILAAAKVPDGVGFDGNDLPHYYRDATVESRMTVYISPNGKKYHRTFGCSGAYESIHLFTAASSRIPCSKCIPFAAMNYKVPEWYYRYLQLVTRQDRLKERNSTKSEK